MKNNNSESKFKTENENHNILEINSDQRKKTRQEKKPDVKNKT
jgi:hypothetical protein